MKNAVIGLVLLIAIAVTTSLQSDFLRHRPTILKLGPVPHAGLLKALAGEHGTALAVRSITRVMFYFGSFFDPDENRLQKFPEYFSMFKHLEHAIKLDPYNMDAYYFSQAAFTWEVGHAKEVNKMLEYGMKYRTWDYLLPFYAGFNAAYFLHDYKIAAEYMQIAAEMSNNPLFTRLAARYFHESGQAGLGLVFLETMAKGAQSEKIRRIYETRITALKAVKLIEDSIAEYVSLYNEEPELLTRLVDVGLMQSIPQDPYGGDFYIDGTGKVRTTSNFAIKADEAYSTKELLELDDTLQDKKENP